MQHSRTSTALTQPPHTHHTSDQRAFGSVDVRLPESFVRRPNVKVKSEVGVPWKIRSLTDSYSLLKQSATNGKVPSVHTLRPDPT